MVADTDPVGRLEARLAELKDENATLRAALDRLTGTSDTSTPGGDAASASAPSADKPARRPDASFGNALSAREKIALFRDRFAGRDDLFAQRWESRDGTRRGYAPACANEWIPGVCEKPRVKCHACRHRAFVPVTDAVIHGHLTGTRTVGRYALDAAGRCRFVVADFDHESWREDAAALARTARRANVPTLVEISRSGDGAHVWCFFDAPVAAARARRLVTALIERTCREERLLSLSSHDRLIPAQDGLSGAGFGSLVALPLQHGPRQRGASVFVDEGLEPFADPWAALQATASIRADELEALIGRVEDGHGGLDALLGDPDGEARPWDAARARRPAAFIRPGDMPDEVRVTLADGVHVSRDDLPQSAVYAVARLAAFANPTWHELVRTNRSTWNTPRFVEVARALPRHVRVPRGCLDAVRILLEAAGSRVVLDDERHAGTALDAAFAGTLRPDQRAALKALSGFDAGTLHAVPGFGKTVTAAALIAHRGRSTLVIVHTTALLAQWRASLARFLGRPPRSIGRIGGAGKHRVTGEIDVAGIQSLARLDDEALEALLVRYGHLVIDECHHAGAASHVRVLETARARYVTGLSATPERRDGLGPLVELLCGPIRHRAVAPRGTAAVPSLELVVETVTWDVVPDTPDDAPVQTMLSAVAIDAARTAMLAARAVGAWRAGRKVLVLTERRGHVEALVAAIGLVTDGPVPTPIVLHGQLARGARKDAMSALAALEPDAARCLVATGRLVGEGFDHPALDTLVFAMPIAWRGTLAQYVGRLARPAPGKVDARVIDVHDTGHPILESMWRKRAAGYRALGWREEAGSGSLF